MKVNSLIENEKSLKKDIKTLQTNLHNYTKDFIENLSDDSAIEVLKAKWITPIYEGIMLLPDSIVSALEKKINTLTKKYSVTMLDIESDLKQSEQEFCSMIDDLEGSEFDMLGLKELQKILKGYLQRDYLSELYIKEL